MEIYIEHITLEKIMRWLVKHYRVNGSLVDIGNAKVAELEIKKILIPVIITTGIEGTDFTSIWFNSEKLPWSNDNELAKFAAIEFKSKIRYAKQDSSPAFYELFNGRVSEITWK